MKEQLEKYTDEAFDMVEYAANEIGQRVPGTDGEKKFHDYLADKLKEIGLKPKTEKFIFAPRGSIGGLPYAGWGGIVLAILLYLSIIVHGIVESGGAHLATIALLYIATLYAIGLWIWVICSVFKYKTWFDWCFHQEVSYNTYAELLPKDGKYDHTIFLSGHTDTSWTLKHSAAKTHPALVYVKIGIGAVSVGAITLLTLLIALTYMIGVYAGIAAAAKVCGVAMKIAVIALPFFMIGSYMLCLYNEKNPRVASPGAMDNATGVAIAYETVKYFKENPDQAPETCRLVVVGCGAEESGLRGSINFVRAHKKDGMLENAYHINIDSIADKDFFEVVHGDAWLCPHFDKDLEKMSIEAMKEAGVNKPGNIANPVGGCDSTPFQKAGVKSITLAAQDPAMTWYYHTLYDVPERFEKETVGKGLDIVLRLIEKIEDSRKAEKH